MDAVSGKAKLKPGKAITVDFGEAGRFTFWVPSDVQFRAFQFGYETQGDCKIIHHEAATNERKRA